MLAMVSGGVIFAPNPIDGITFVFEPVLPLAAAIVQGAEGITVKPYGATLFAFAAVIMVSSVVPVDHRLGRAPAPAAVRGAGVSAHRPRRLVARVAAAPTACCSALCWAAGLALVAIAAAIVLYMALQGRAVPAPGAALQPPAVAELDQSKSGGFLDPLLGTLLIVVGAIVIAAPLGIATAVWLTEYGKPTWLARAVESGVEVIAGTPSIVLALFGLAFFAQQRPRLPLHHRRGRRRLRALAADLLHGAVARGAAADRRRDARGPAGHAAPRARGVVRARQDARGDDPSRAAAGRAAEHRHRLRARHGPRRRRHGGRAAARRRHAAARGQRLDPGPERAAGHGLDADDLRLRELALGRGRRAAEGVRGGVPAAAAGARPQLGGRPDRPRHRSRLGWIR